MLILGSSIKAMFFLGELDVSTFHCYFHFLLTLRSYLAAIFVGCELTTFFNKCVGALFLDNDISGGGF